MLRERHIKASGPRTKGDVVQNFKKETFLQRRDKDNSKNLKLEWVERCCKLC